MPISSSVSEQIRNTIRIEAFIYHVLRGGEEEPTYYDKVELTNEQRVFFEGQIKNATEGTQFIFLDRGNNTFEDDTNRILNDFDAELSNTSRRLAQRFLGTHNGSTNDGIFIVSVFSMLIEQNRKRFLAILKVDFSTVYRQNVREEDHRRIVSLERVIDSLSDNPRSLQKWAVIDPSDTYVWDVVALQRHKSAADKDTNNAVSKYFRGFLGVEVRETPSVLTKHAHQVVSSWAKTVTDFPDGSLWQDYRSRAVDYLTASDSFDTDNFIGHVLGSYLSEGMNDGEIAERTALKESHAVALREQLTQKGVAGQVFQCMHASLGHKKKTTLKTAENVQIVYQGTTEASGITVLNDPVTGDKIIQIKTSSYETLE